MFKLDENEIIKNWPKNWKSQIPEVSIRCITFNHAPYIAQALDSFLMQKTNFSFEIVVHDDASTDGTVNVIREYEKKYPLIVKPIYEVENQYSKKDGSLNKIMDNACMGKYIAFCEGDDYWCDDCKLQKQYDFLEEHPNFSACAHNTKRVNLINKQFDILYPAEDVVLQSDFYEKEFHINSLMCKKDYLLNRPVFKLPIPGDVIVETYLKSIGPICRFGDVMSVYRYGVSGSWTNRISRNRKAAVENSKNILAYYEYFINCVPNQFQKNISRCIEKQKFLILRGEGRAFEARKTFPDIWNELSMKTKIRFFLDSLRLLLKM